MNRAKVSVLVSIVVAVLAAGAFAALSADRIACNRFSTQHACAPSALSYPTPPELKVGVAMTPLSPAVQGIVLLYVATPALPPGLRLSPITGVVSGTPRAATPAHAYTITALNLAGRAQYSLSLSVLGVLPPTDLSYPATTPLLIGKAIAPLTPIVVGGAVSNYSVAPALPAGLSIDQISGVISGTPSVRAPAAPYAVTARNAAGQTSYTFTLQVDSGPTVHLTATATDPQGFALSYQWKTTDGELLQTDGASAEWLLPAGPGVHFAYVLVANGHGGYTERRFAVITDDIGNPSQLSAPIHRGVPATSAPTAPPGKVTVLGGILNPPYASADLSPEATYGIRTGKPDVALFLTVPGSTVRYPVTGFLTTDADGAFYVPRNDTLYTYNCSFNGGLSFLDCGFPGALTHVTGGYLFPNLVGAPAYSTGTVALADGSVCGLSNEFFGIESSATVTVLDASGNVVQGPVRAGRLGDFSIANLPGQITVVVKCEGNAAQSVPMYNGQLGTFTFAAARPLISNMEGQFNGAPIGVFLPPPAGFPSDAIADAGKFLSFRGIDSRQSACQYYLAVGAVGSCDANGNYADAVSFDDWRRDAQIDTFAPAGAPPTYTATYINKVDLNLTRNHHSISYGATNTSAYVCNSLGPKVLDAAQAEIDSVIASAVDGRNLVACVAMDYRAWPGVNDGAPFTRFLTFGPNGQLLVSVNLDGRGEKFMPGTCVACHGGDNYLMHFPTDGSGNPDIGAHFLPYDPANFSFATPAGFTLADQQPGIHGLNMNVLQAGANQATEVLVNGWYANGPVADLNFVPPLWKAWPGPSGPVDFSQFYLKAFAPACRTCHVAAYSQLAQSPTDASAAAFICQPSSSVPITGYSMPNSLVTFNRFWLSAKELDGGQPAAMAELMRQFAALYGPSPALPCSFPP